MKKSNVLAKSLLLTSALLTLTTSASVEFVSFVPHIFTDGTTASAQQVNENFKTIDQRVSTLSGDVGILKGDINFITGRSTDISQRVTSNSMAIDTNSVLMNNNSNNINTLDSRVSTNEESMKISACTTGSEWNSTNHNVTFQEKSSIVGQEIVINNNSYRIVLIPFVEYSTGDVYHIKLPVKESSPGIVPVNNLTTIHSSDISTCSSLNISGFPARLGNVTESRTISYTNDGSTNSSSSSNVSYSLSIKVGETLLSIFYHLSELELTALMSANKYDFTRDINTSLMTEKTALINEIDVAVDYITISKAL